MGAVFFSRKWSIIESNIISEVVAVDRDYILRLLLEVAVDGSVQGVLALGHSEWNRQIKKSLLHLASTGYIELLSEIELTEVGIKINCRLTDKALPTELR